MNSFIEDFLQNPASAIASAQERTRNLSWISGIDDEVIYDALASGEFRLYETMILSPSSDDCHGRKTIRPVA